jgi:hypothetical protein
MDRRGLLLGLGASLIAAPAIVRAASMMPVRGIVMPVWTRIMGVDFSSCEQFLPDGVEAPWNANFSRVVDAGIGCLNRQIAKSGMIECHREIIRGGASDTFSVQVYLA